MDEKKLLSKLSQNLIELLDDEEYHDTIIKVGNHHKKRYRAHMVILHNRSSYFRNILSTADKSGTNLVRINLPNISPKIFDVMLR